MFKLLKAKISELSEEEFSNALSEMSEERKNAVLRYRSRDDRKRTVLGEILAKQGISEYIGREKAAIKLARTEKGKPFAVGEDIHFSVAHCDDLAVCAVSESNIGIDAERLRPVNLDITRIACNESDLEFVFSDSSPEAQARRFLLLWTAKEAYFKFIGTGITNLKSVCYRELEPHCRVFEQEGYIITVYRP